jgi:hypothetical protein
MRFAPLLALLVLASACAGNPEDDLCAAASAHVAACLGGEARSWGDACEGDAALLAEHALSASCDQLVVADAKADASLGGVGGLACIALGVPVFATGAAEKSGCCFDHNCAGALVCRRFTCQKKSAAGGPCDRATQCQSGLACKSGRCGTPVARGGSCDKTDACAANLVCDSRKRCNPPAADGAVCTKDEHCESWRCVGGRCTTPGEVGAPCGTSTTVCANDLVCSSGACAEPAASGQACARGDTFACPRNETCWDGRCERQRDEGGACAMLFDCKFGLFCGSGVCQPFGS